MVQKSAPCTEIAKALIPIHKDIPEWTGIRYVGENAAIVYNRDSYLAVCLNGQWRLLGIITNMWTIQKHLTRPLVNFHDAWSRGLRINKPKLKQN